MKVFGYSFEIRSNLTVNAYFLWRQSLNWGFVCVRYWWGTLSRVLQQIVDTHILGIVLFCIFSNSMHVYSEKHRFFLLAVLVAYSSNSPPLGPLSICGFLYFTLKCWLTKGHGKVTKRSKQKQRLSVSVSLGLYSGLSLEHKRLVKKSLPCLHPVQHRLSRNSVVFVFVLLFFCFCDFSKQSVLDRRP